MEEYIAEKNGSKEFKKKPKQLKHLINEALYILETFGIPIDGLTSRRLEKMALCVLALADVKDSSGWSTARSISDGVSMKSRQIINYINENGQDEISSGSYDDIRRKDLKLPVLAGVVVRTKPGSARNDSTRGYAISEEHADLMRQFGKKDWPKMVEKALGSKTTLAARLSEDREMDKVVVKLPGGTVLKFSLGKHNALQKQIIEEFLPRFAPGAQLLYVGDTADKFLYMEKETLKKLNFFELLHGELPDVVAYMKDKNWLFLIEAVHTSGPISKTRKMELEELTKETKAEIVYVTAFLDKATYRKYTGELAWETEVWIAESPDHLIHLNGHKFLGPYK